MRKRIPIEIYAKILRERMTPCELKLWNRLKYMQEFKFEPQIPVHGFIPDFFCEELQLAIEVDGQIHKTWIKKKKDQRKDTILARKGVKVIRFTNTQVANSLGRVVKAIRIIATMHRNAQECIKRKR